MIKKIISQFIYQFGNYILPFLIIPFLINKLSLETYKDFVVIQTLVIFFAVLVSYGLDLFGVRYVSSNWKVKRICKQFLYISLISRIIIFLCCCILLFISLCVLTKYNITYWILCFFWLSSFVLQSNWYLQGVGDFKFIALYGLIPKLILYPFVFIFIHNDRDAWIYLLLCGLANYLSNIIMFRHAMKSLDGVAFSSRRLGRKIWLFLRKGWYLFLSQASITLISYANIFFLPLVLDAKSFVVFSTADRVVKVLSIATTPVLNVLFPYISSLIPCNKEKAFLLISRISLISILIFLFCYIIYIMIGHHFVQLLFPKIATQLYLVLLCLLFNVLFVFLNNLYGTQIGLNFGKDRIFSKIVASNGLLSIMLMSAGGVMFSLNGVVISSLYVQISILVCMYLLSKKCGYRFKV